jgi:hypothetical protein
VGMGIGSGSIAGRLGDPWKAGRWEGGETGRREYGELRCESEESFHDESRDDAFYFTNPTARGVRSKSPYQKRRNKCEQNLEISSQSPTDPCIQSREQISRTSE